MILKLLKKHIVILHLVYGRNLTFNFMILFLFAEFMANIGAKLGYHSFLIWFMCVLTIYHLFKNALDMAELGY